MEDTEVEFAELSKDGTTYEGDVTYLRDEELDGRSCALLEVDFEFTTSVGEFDSRLVGFDPEEMGFGEAEVLTDYELTAEGTTQVWVDRKTGRPVSEEESVTASIEVVFTVADEAQGFELKIVSDISLTVTSTVTWSELDSE